MVKRILIIAGLLLLVAMAGTAWYAPQVLQPLSLSPGDKTDSLHGVYVYYNGSIGHVDGRNRTADGYNLGLKYQCVEFVKRYYYYHYKHKMPDTYGNARDFFKPGLADGAHNKQRNLLQYTNPSASCPQEGDLLIMDGHPGNPYGHVAIVSAVYSNCIEIVQQNPGPMAASRVDIALDKAGNKFYLQHDLVLGWLRKKH